MNDVPDILATLAEIAVTLAGFTGLILVFRNSGNWNEALGQRIYGILYFCSVALIAAVLPFGLRELSSDSTVYAGVPLLFLGLCILGLALLNHVQARRQTFTYTRSWAAGINYVSFLIALLTLAAAFEIYVPRSFGVLILGILWVLILGGLTFVLSIVRVEEGKED